MTAAPLRASIARDAVIENLDAFLALGFDVGDALLALGAGYEAVRKHVSRAGRTDLSEALSAWKKADTERLLRARGLTWR